MRLYITGEINDESFHEFSQALAELEESSFELDENGLGLVEVELISDGGSAYAALAFYDRIINSHITVNITATGIVASAATLVLAAGDTRRMTTNAWAMVHEDTTDVTKGMMVSKAEAVLRHNRALETQWNELLESQTDTPVAVWEKLNREETFLDAETCKKLGLIEEIV